MQGADAILALTGRLRNLSLQSSGRLPQTQSREGKSWLGVFNLTNLELLLPVAAAAAAVNGLKFFRTASWTLKLSS
jgi:hypothetical protein